MLAARGLVVVGLVLFGALSLLPRVEAQQPDPAARHSRAAALRATGQRFLAAGDPGSAIAYFRDAVGVDPDDAESYDLLGLLYLERARVRDAIDTFRAGLRRRPEHARLWRDLGRALESTGDLEEASRALRECTRRAPEDAFAFLARASLARRRSKWSEALGAYRRVLDLAPTTPGLDAARVDEARRFVSALELLVGTNDPASDPSVCADASGSRATLVRRTLARCR